MEMSESGRSFRFTWKLKNFSFLWHRELQFLKRTFNITGNTTTSWSLLLYPSTPKNCVSCVLRKEKEALHFLVDYELSFLGENGSPLCFKKVTRADFSCKNRSMQLWLHHDEILENKGAFLPEDILSISCIIWPSDSPNLEMVRYLAETEVKVQQCVLTWDIFAFSHLKPGKKRTELVKNKLSGNMIIYFSIFLDEWNNLIFEIFVPDPKIVELCRCQIFLVAASGERWKCGRFEVVTIGKTTDPDWKFHLSLTKRILMDTKELYLPNDTLTLQCEAAIASGIEEGPVQKLKSDCVNIQNIPCSAETANISKSLKKYSGLQPASKNDMQSSNNVTSLNVEFNVTSLKYDINVTSPRENNVSKPLKANTVSNSLLPWKDNLLKLYEKGTFCDAELLVTTSCFPVHSLILSIRSPVFCDLFTQASSDGKRKSIQIKDLDADTVGKMILFLYTDTLEDLEWNCAKGLYSASNKYEILPLRDLSLSFLRQNLSTINYCDILLLADRYKDDYLKQVVNDFISEHDEVLKTEQWRCLEESHPRLAIETFRIMHFKFRNKKLDCFPEY